MSEINNVNEDAVLPMPNFYSGEALANAEAADMQAWSFGRFFQQQTPAIDFEDDVFQGLSDDEDRKSPLTT